MSSEYKPIIPIPDITPRKLTAEEYLEFTPEKLELVDGDYAPQSMMPNFVTTVLANVGLEFALSCAPLERWKEAIRKVETAQQIFPDETTLS